MRTSDIAGANHRQACLLLLLWLCNLSLPSGTCTSAPAVQVLRPHVLQPDGPGIRVQLPPLAAAQQAQHGALPAADSCAQETAAAAAKVTEQAAAAAEVTEQAAAAAEAAAVQRGAGAGEAEKPLLLRMEPMVGCLTTCEAGAIRSLCRLPLMAAAAGCYCCSAAFGAGVLVVT